MKYIRTKDGRIYEIIDETENSFELCGSFEKKMGCSCTMIKRLLGNNEKPTYRLANTIEELCDEFVLDHPLFGDNCKCLYHSFEKAKNGIKKRSDNAHNLYDFNIYGAIWTEWGLKYVAKMNDKGELELL